MGFQLHFLLLRLYPSGQVYHFLPVAGVPGISHCPYVPARVSVPGRLRVRLACGTACLPPGSPRSVINQKSEHAVLQLLAWELIVFSNIHIL